MCRLFLVVTSLLLILFGVGGLLFMPKLIQQKIEHKAQIKIGTKFYERFTKVPIPLTLKFYLFNVTNKEQVLAGLEDPKFQEVGPFMYKQWRRREVEDFEDNNRKLRYREKKIYIPMLPDNLTSAHISGDKDNKHISALNNSITDQDVMLDPYKTTITTINVPLLSVLTIIAQKSEGGTLKRNLIAKIADRLVEDREDKILITKPANQLLFDGYKIDFLESVRELISEILGYNFTSPFKRNIFGFLHNRNDTWNPNDDGVITIFTGRSGSLDDIYKVDSWKDKKVLDVWPTSANNRCNKVTGTDGSQFHPGVTKHKILTIFSPMICTSITIHFKEDTNFRGIKLLRFAPSPDAFAAPKKNPTNACYCTITSDGNSSSFPSDRRCYLDGLLDLRLCKQGAPIAVSSPHFFNGDPMLSQVAGLRPEREIHQTYIDIEPMTGIVFRASSRAQLNAYVEQGALDVLDSKVIGKMKHMVAPLFWLEEHGEIDETVANEFKGKLYKVVVKARNYLWAATIVGPLILIIVALQYWWSMKRSSATSKRTPGVRYKDNLLSGARKSNLAAKDGTKLLDSDSESCSKSLTNSKMEAGPSSAFIDNFQDSKVSNTLKDKSVQIK